MLTDLVLSFAMLFGAVVALFCAVYIYIALRNKSRHTEKTQQ